MVRLGVAVSRLLRLRLRAGWLLLVFLAAVPVRAREPNPAKYPLHVHVLVSDQSYRTPRMSPGDSVTCDAIEGMVSSGAYGSTGPVTINGLSGDPCSLNPSAITGQLLDFQNEEFGYSGGGRADLVSPPTVTQGLSFHYDNCGRVRVQAGFQSLPARWKRRGKKLEVLVPSDAIPVIGHPHPFERCTFDVTLHDFVYLLLRNGAVIEVSQEDYWKRPALRPLLSGLTPTVQQRVEQFTVSARPAH